MNSGSESERDMIHRLLDEDLPLAEQQAVTEKIAADPELREEFEGLQRAVEVLKKSERRPAPPFFAAQVMKRLPERRETFGKRIKNFLLRPRTVRWNMATALATLCLTAFVLVQAVRLGHAPVVAPGAPPQEQTVAVEMSFYAPQARNVSVAGTFNKWKVDADILTRQENGTWTIKLPLKPGEYNYMFIVDGKAWIPDPNAESYHDDGFGSKNSVMRVRT